MTLTSMYSHQVQRTYCFHIVFKTLVLLLRGLQVRLGTGGVVWVGLRCSMVNGGCVSVCNRNVITERITDVIT